MKSHIVLSISFLISLATTAPSGGLSGWGMFNLGTDVKNIIFTLSNRGNGYQDQVLVPEDDSSFDNSSWDKTQKTIIVIHGYSEDGSGGAFSTTKKIVAAYADTKRPENLVFVDWHTLGRQLNYFDSADNVVRAGLRVTEFLVYLRGRNFIQNLADVRLVGFSLGGHVSGVAAHYATENLGEVISRISGVDPAGPGFINRAEEERLGPDDAAFVDVIHTNMGNFTNTFGTPRVSGHIDFYPNGGEHQPGCAVPGAGATELVGICSHIKGVDYFANTVLGKVYTGCKCKDYPTFVTGACTCLNGPRMGEFVSQSARGQYYLTIPLGQ